VAITALQSLQLLERHYRHAAVAAPVSSEVAMQWAGTALSIAGVPLLLGEGEVEEIIEMPPVTRIPGTKPWVLGVGSHKGTLLPVFSGDVLFRRVPYNGRVRDYCMVIRRQGLFFAITLSGIWGSLRLPLEERDMEHAIDRDFSEYCLGGFHYRDKFMAVLDIDKLVADPEFANASASEEDSIEE
jgi:twitching motility protein PilI